MTHRKFMDRSEKMKEIEIQQNNINELIKLTQQYPDLEIVPMIDNDLGGDEYSYYMGKWGKPDIEEIYHEDERIYFRSDDEEELVEKKMDIIFDEEYVTHQYLNDEELKVVADRATKQVEELEWEKVIVVYINCP